MAEATLYVKAQTYFANIFNVEKVSLKICGGQAIEVIDPSNEIFSIIRD